MNTYPLDEKTRVIIDKTLKNLGWNLTGAQQNVFLGQHAASEKMLPPDCHPDYVLVSSKEKKPLIVIEVKKKGMKIEDALEQGIWYAKMLDAPLVFATDGLFCKTYHIKYEKPPVLNGGEVNSFLREELAVKYLNTSEINTVSSKVQYDRKELIKIFDEANNMLRGDGLRAGIERFGEFANILFLKLISESEDVKKNGGIYSAFDNACHWDAIGALRADSRIDYINKIVYEKLNTLYQTKIFTPLSIRDAFILKDIMDKLSPLTLTDVDSDVKGDAFEYFLKESTAAKNDLGEYFTPRHIVKAMVKIVNPQIGEKVYDPFCGTGGFLIESYRHIWNTMPRNETTGKMLGENTIFGNEITNTARITKMNMILAGGGHSNIHMRDSLANPVDGKYDVVLANMPYSQKTRYGGLYDLPTNNGDSICVQHCIKAINAAAENGRMAIVVPEGFLFRKDLKKTRELLLRSCNLHSVISLPRGVFLPYTGVKTNIIYATKIKSENIPCAKPKNYWYFEAKSDGYSLDNHRRKLDGVNDLDRYLEYRKLDTGHSEEMLDAEFEQINLEKVKENHCILVGGRYRRNMEALSEYQMAALGDILSVRCGSRITQGRDSGTQYPVYGGGESSFYTDTYTREDDYIIARFGVSEKCVRYICGKFYLLDSGFTFHIKKEYQNKINKDYIGRLLLNRQDEIFACARGQAQKNIDFDLFNNILVPLPPAQQQRQIARELEEYRATIENAAHTAESYRAHILLSPVTPKETIGALCIKTISGGTPSTKAANYWDGDIPWITSADIDIKRRINVRKFISAAGIENSTAKIVPRGNIIVASRVGLGKIALNQFDVAINQDLQGLILNTAKVLPRFFEFVYSELVTEILSRSRGTTIKGITKQELLELKIPIPSMGEQIRAVEQINRELELVCAAGELSSLLGEKIKRKISLLYK